MPRLTKEEMQEVNNSFETIPELLFDIRGLLIEIKEKIK